MAWTEPDLKRAHLGDASHWLLQFMQPTTVGCISKTPDKPPKSAGRFASKQTPQLTLSSPCTTPAVTGSTGYILTPTTTVDAEPVLLQNLENRSQPCRDCNVKLRAQLLHLQ